jgi:predicted O-linked N-acetylglucosamine transferase (SPINDLY family)
MTAVKPISASTQSDDLAPLSTVTGGPEWLEFWLLRCLPEPPGSHPCAELRDISLVALIAAIEGAKPPLADPIEARLYRDWIVANPGAPYLCGAWFNLGVALARGGHRENAIAAYRQALALKPDLTAASINLGILLEATGHTMAALETWGRALQPDESRVALLNQRARVLENLGELAEAEAALRASLLTSPEQPDAIHHWVHIRQKMCLWPVLSLIGQGLSPAVLLRNSGPLAVMALTDDVEIQAAAAESWIQRKTQAVPAISTPEDYQHKRIRVGYLSSDFCSHAMSYLIAELFERHDRSRFDVYGYCSSPEDGSGVRLRIKAAFDHFRIVRHLSDEQAARVIREDEIDVLVDLNGLTAGARMQILRFRPAPVQVTYLGFVGPVPLPELDYLLCDDFVIPAAQAGAYRPKPLAVGPVYQCNDNQRQIGRGMSRDEVGLPDDRFVFCCFSNHYKITEEMFSAWMAIMRQADRSVLWLSSDSAWARENTCLAARQHDVAPERLIFATRTSPDLYMSRLQLADLFLDTFPYNAGTIASDALRMRLPLITLCGRSFASRMAARLLDALGAHQGITGSLDEYVATAARLATDEKAYLEFKNLFTPEVWSATLGNIERFTADFEATLIRLMKRN